MKASPKWTEEENQIVRENSTSDAVRLLPSRTLAAVKTRRRELRVSKTKSKQWSKAEDRRLKKYAHETIKKLAKRFKNRTLEAVKGRRVYLCPTFKLEKWTGAELTKLKRLWPSATRRELEIEFPGRTWSSLYKRARKVDLLRPFSLFDTGDDYINQIKQRAHEDGIAMLHVSQQSGAGSNFLSKKHKPGRLDMNRVDRCVRFFGGKLVIDWQDE